MVILVVPMFSVTHLNADSNYVILRHVIPEIIEQTDWLFEILWPQNGSDWDYFHDGFFDHPNIKRRPFYFDQAKMRQVMSFDPRAWHKLLDYKGQYHDLIWNNTVEIADALKFFHPRYVDNARTTIVNFHHYVLHHTTGYPTEAYQHVLMRQLTGSIAADINVVNSAYTEQMLQDNMREYLSDEMGKQVAAATRTIGYGTLPDDPYQPQKRAEMFTFAYNHRLQDYKNWRKTFDRFEELYRIRQDFRVKLLASGSDQHIGEIAMLPFVDVLKPQNHDQYLRELSECHANVTDTQYETFCVSAIESMMFDHVLLAPKGLTFPEVTGGFFVKDPTLGKLADTIDGKYREIGEDGGSFVRAEHTASNTATKIRLLFEELRDKVRVKDSLRRPETWEKLILSQDTWLLEDLRRSAYSSRSHGGKALAAGQSFPMVKIKRLMSEMGYQSTWTERGELQLHRGKAQ